MRIGLLCFIVLTATSLCAADEESAFKAWVFPGAELKAQSLSPVTATSADGEIVQSRHTGWGQYVTEKPFHEVVAFYVRKSGLKPPNWSILGREFPGDRIQIPGHWSHTNFRREAPSVTILHYIREDIATLQVLVTDDPELGFVSVSVTRGQHDDQTVIQLIEHSAEHVE